MDEARQHLADERIYLNEEIQSEYNFEEIIGESAPLQAVLDHVKTVAPTDSTVLVLGETGTGKELIARCDSRDQLAAGSYICKGELCRYPAWSAGERIVRS